jgi:NTE family protein
MRQPIDHQVPRPPASPVTRRRALSLAASLGSSLTFSACTLAPDHDHNGDSAPRYDSSLNRPARMAWVLSSGGPRGFVHVGVIKALEELGLKPDLIVGGSVGALVGALYACGIKAPELETLALDIGPTDLGRWAPTGETRFAGTPIADLVNGHVQYRSIEKLPTRFAAAAIERSSRQAMLFNAGDTGVAVQASCAIEGRLTPVRIRGQQYVDPDLAAPLPVRLARALGAQKVLAIDASAHESKAPAGAERYRTGDSRKRQLTEPDAQAANLTLHPEFGYWVSLTREFRERTIAAGYEQTLAQAAALRALHA